MIVIEIVIGYASLYLDVSWWCEYNCVNDNNEDDGKDVNEDDNDDPFLLSLDLND